MEEHDIIVIGAGISGLAAGCYARMNGYRVRIFEQDTRPGGLCTSWERKGYTINGGLAFLGGSGPHTDFYRIWQELGVVPSTRMIDYEYFVIIEGRSGERFCMHTDVDRLDQHMKELAPEDAKVIDEFVKGIRCFTKYQFPVAKAQELYTPWDKIRLLFTHLPMLQTMGKWKKVSIKEFANRFKNPFLREAFHLVKALFSDDLPMVMIQLFMAWSHLRSCGFPEGGALAFSETIAKRFRNLGGEITYGAAVERILVENGKAVGIRLRDGSEYRAQYVVSAADGRSTLFEMLEGKYLDDEIRGYYDKLAVATSVALVALGVRRRFDDFPHTGIGIIFPLEEPVMLGGREARWLRPMVYNFDPSLAPEGGTFIRVVLPVDYDYWKMLKEKGNAYETEKARLAETVISLLERRFPGVAADVEMHDVATPLTFERYTGSWQGSIIGWDVTTRTAFMSLRKTLPGLQNFWMTGQWVEMGGGVPMVALSGRNLIQLITRKDKRPFIVTSD